MIEPNIGSPLFYGVFFIAVLLMIGIDMLSLKKTGEHKVSAKEALIWSALWVGVSCLFAGWLYWELSGSYGEEMAKTKVMEYFTGYVLEKSLAVDNLFVFLMIFSYFKVPAKYQHRVLLYGVFGAIVLRVIMISIGAVLVSEFQWILYLFGAFLLYTGIKMIKHTDGDNDEQEMADNKMLVWLKKRIKVSEQLDGEKFFTVENGKRIATPLLLVLIMVELSDVVFAVDSIPAIFAVTTDPFIVLTSNIFAILGLRAMYFLLADMADRFIFLNYGLAFVLSFIGIKMLIMHWIHIPVSVSLAVVFGALGASILTSLVYSKRLKAEQSKAE
ncbi:MAG: TerC family protein [Neisseria sp.]|nr:TerC family protein [Neisseria sp.]